MIIKGVQLCWIPLIEILTLKLFLSQTHSVFSQAWREVSCHFPLRKSEDISPGSRMDALKNTSSRGTNITLGLLGEKIINSSATQLAVRNPALSGFTSFHPKLTF